MGQSAANCARMRQARGERTSKMSAGFLVCVLLACGVLLAEPVRAVCSGQPVDGGRCVNYTGYCSHVVGSVIFFNDSNPIEDSDAVLFETLQVIRSNEGILSPECVRAADWFVCSAMYSPCFSVGGARNEGVPILPCDSDCADFWAFCQQGFNVYLDVTLNFNWRNSETVLCVNGSFTNYPATSADPPVADVIGGRMLPLTNMYAVGYAGTLRYPVSTARYTLSNGTQVVTSCYHPSRPSPSAALIQSTEPDTCHQPFVTGVDAQGNPSCVVPCPFPVFTDAELNAVQVAYEVPGIIGFTLCALVFVDTVWFLCDAGGLSLGLARGCCHCSRVRAVPPIRPITWYTLVGSLLAITFFCIGPLCTCGRLLPQCRGGCSNALTLHLRSNAHSRQSHFMWELVRVCLDGRAEWQSRPHRLVLPRSTLLSIHTAAALQSHVLHSVQNARSH